MKKKNADPIIFFYEFCTGVRCTIDGRIFAIEPIGLEI